MLSVNIKDSMLRGSKYVQLESCACGVGLGDDERLDDGVLLCEGTQCVIADARGCGSLSGQGLKCYERTDGHPSWIPISGNSSTRPANCRCALRPLIYILRRES